MFWVKNNTYNQQQKLWDKLPFPHISILNLTVALFLGPQGLILQLQHWIKGGRGDKIKMSHFILLRVVWIWRQLGILCCWHAFESVKELLSLLMTSLCWTLLAALVEQRDWSAYDFSKKHIHKKYTRNTFYIRNIQSIYRERRSVPNAFASLENKNRHSSLRTSILLNMKLSETGEIEKLLHLFSIFVAFLYR